MDSAQGDSNARGIPTAPFVTDVAEFIGGADKDVMPTLQQFQDAISKYKFMEMSTAQRRKGLEQKIPDISKTLQMVEFLKTRKEHPDPTEVTFELNDTLFARAELDPVDRVHLWLGANVMLSYEIDEAISLLKDKLDTAKKNLDLANKDLGFLRDQITTMEVNTARVHNWDVKRRREL
ncbi:prefoldin subunit 3 [Malassezia pachydermatis]|uniref:Prefoldin subunit 3 n=1 Tax=Malassezia pachydermatis TaxID=77020 RepID=A0A0M8MN61_9BASI|nr:prefoldin subunit 3 [Malassezia pachydermatis]KOS15866.1 prefoldin subunit 3 [Malassezia pachydermatis]